MGPGLGPGLIHQHAPSFANTWRNRVRRRGGLAPRAATRYNRGMSVMMRPLAPVPAVTTPAPDPAPLLEELATLRLENAALRTENAALQERVRELEARLGQTSV